MIALSVSCRKIVALGEVAPDYIADALTRAITKSTPEGMCLVSVGISWVMKDRAWYFEVDPRLRRCDTVASPCRITADDFPLADLLAT